MAIPNTPPMDYGVGVGGVLYLLHTAVPTTSWCLLDRINEPSNQSGRDPGVHMVIDGTCQVARQCFWRCFMFGKNANKRGE